MQNDSMRSDSDGQINAHTNQDLDHHVCEKLIDNFDYTALDVFFWGQPPPYSQLSAAIIPNEHHYAKNHIIISKTSNPKDFFLVSSIIYFIWGVLAFILTIALTMISLLTPYFILWSVFLILNGAINIYTILSWSSISITHLKCMFSFTLLLNIMGFILSTVINHSTVSIVCLNPSNFPCDSILASYSELIYRFIFLLAAAHNAFNIVIINNTSKGIPLKPLPSSV